MLKLHKITRFLRLFSCCIPQSGSLKRAVICDNFLQLVAQTKGIEVLRDWIFGKECSCLS